MTGGLILLSCGPHFGLGSDGRDGTVGTWKVRVTVPTKQKTSAITHSDWIGLDWLFDPLRGKGQGRGKGYLATACMYANATQIKGCPCSRTSSAGFVP